MKNYIAYYYDLGNFSIKMISSELFIITNGQNIFKLYFVSRNINELTNILKNIKIPSYFNKIVLNKSKDIYTKIGNNYYVLVKEVEHDLNIMNIIHDCDILFRSSNNFNKWNKLWSDKIDAFESENNYYESSLKNYLIGLGENAIQYSNLVNYKNVSFSISHYRMNDFYNPLTIIIDYSVRDVAEYLKYNFFIDNITDDDIIYLLYNNKFSKDDYILFFSRMLFPSIFFDFISNDSELKFKYIKKISLYIPFLIRIHKLILDYGVNLPSIDWIINQR